MEGVQQALLKLIEGNKVDVQLAGQRRHPYSETVEIDTSKILFIVGGAFPGIEKLIKKRLNIKQTSTVGIKLNNKDTETTVTESDYNDIIDKITTDDFRKYGLIPEFLGRLPIICPLHQLTEDELCQILTEPKNALIKQYQTMLAYDNVELKFDREAVKAIAKKAIKNKTGARGLRAIMENTLLNVMFKTPDSARKNKHSIMNITADCIEEDIEPVLHAV